MRARGHCRPHAGTRRYSATDPLVSSVSARGLRRSPLAHLGLRAHASDLPHLGTRPRRLSAGRDDGTDSGRGEALRTASRVGATGRKRRPHPSPTHQLNPRPSTLSYTLIQPRVEGASAAAATVSTSLPGSPEATTRLPRVRPYCSSQRPEIRR
jgi:hypothetical protein